MGAEDTQNLPSAFLSRQFGGVKDFHVVAHPPPPSPRLLIIEDKTLYLLSTTSLSPLPPAPAHHHSPSVSPNMTAVGASRPWDPVVSVSL